MSMTSWMLKTSADSSLSKEWAAAGGSALGKAVGNGIKFLAKHPYLTTGLLIGVPAYFAIDEFMDQVYTFDLMRQQNALAAEQNRRLAALGNINQMQLDQQINPLKFDPTAQMPKIMKRPLT